ncbi:hypothetical protein GA0074695_2146 [Micromonospora viridifaciens]|uniref:Uncharacterized protein n=1 Tax=Micromonospora viridifaciens TaxID=1881 RepID=A0A1C4W7K7_MICVI|nr:hypothetical protein [Micromonospora viridifaciens]SCE91971.1 hypothetical protein GA0074695_2146 [Micromonospora viridifaciens]
MAALLIHLVAALIAPGGTTVIFGLLVPGEAALLLVGFLAYAGTPRLAPALLALTAAVSDDTSTFQAGYGHRPRASAGPPAAPMTECVCLSY